eukprot:s4421_g10.t1
MADRDYEADLKELLKNLKLLLLSSSKGVTLAAAIALCYLGPAEELSSVTMPLMRCLRQATPEATTTLLVALAPLIEAQRGVFRPLLREFFVQSFDSTEVKRLKLEVIENLVDETNVQMVLRELQVYVSWHSQPDFVARAVQSIAKELDVVFVVEGSVSRSRPHYPAPADQADVCSMAFSAAIRRLPGGGFAKMPRSQAMTAIPPQTSLMNICTYFQTWPKHRSMFLMYGTRHSSSAADWLPKVPGTKDPSRIEMEPMATLDGIYGHAGGTRNGAEGSRGHGH